jgi:hypothetical protein
LNDAVANLEELEGRKQQKASEFITETSLKSAGIVIRRRKIV